MTSITAGIHTISKILTGIDACCIVPLILAIMPVSKGEQKI
jgi:hypothetical protein